MPATCRKVFALLLCLSCGGEARSEIRADFEMYRDPQIHVPETLKRFSEGLKPLWLAALARPDADMQRMAADAFARGHAAGMLGMDEAVPALRDVLTNESSHVVARQAAARALVALGARDAAEQLAQSARRFGADLRQAVEPALAEWNYEPMRELWRALCASCSAASLAP